jgi:hypothetical protein
MNTVIVGSTAACVPRHLIDPRDWLQRYWNSAMSSGFMKATKNGSTYHTSAGIKSTRTQAAERYGHFYRQLSKNICDDDDVNDGQTPQNDFRLLV